MADVEFSLHRAKPQVRAFDNPPQRLFKRIVVDDANEEEILLNEILRRLFFVRANQILHVTRTLHLQVGDITRELSQQLVVVVLVANDIRDDLDVKRFAWIGVPLKPKPSVSNCRAWREAPCLATPATAERTYARELPAARNLVMIEPPFFERQ